MLREKGSQIVFWIRKPVPNSAIEMRRADVGVTQDAEPRGARADDADV